MILDGATRVTCVPHHTGSRALHEAVVHVPRMVDLTFFADLMSPPGLISLIALVIAAVAFAGYLRGLREARLRGAQVEVLSKAVEQLTRLSVAEYGGINQLGRSLADALNPTGEPDLKAPERRAAYHALGPEPDRALEEFEVVMGRAGQVLGWRYVPGIREP